MSWEKYSEFERDAVRRGLRQAHEADEEEVAVAGGPPLAKRRGGVSRLKHWYTRHHMWIWANRVRGLRQYRERGTLHYLSELGNDERKDTLVLVNKTLAAHRHMR